MNATEQSLVGNVMLVIAHLRSKQEEQGVQSSMLKFVELFDDCSVDPEIFVTSYRLMKDISQSVLCQLFLEGFVEALSKSLFIFSAEEICAI